MVTMRPGKLSTHPLPGEPSWAELAIVPPMLGDQLRAALQQHTAPPCPPRWGERMIPKCNRRLLGEGDAPAPCLGRARCHMNDASSAVYVVDDDISVRESVHALIHSANLRVESFASAREFLERCRTEVPGCLVLDVNLPGLSGLELQEHLADVGIQVPIV